MEHNTDTGLVGPDGKPIEKSGILEIPDVVPPSLKGIITPYKVTSSDSGIITPKDDGRLTVGGTYFDRMTEVLREERESSDPSQDNQERQARNASERYLLNNNLPLFIKRELTLLPKYIPT